MTRRRVGEARAGSQARRPVTYAIDRNVDLSPTPSNAPIGVAAVVTGAVWGDGVADRCQILIEEVADGPDIDTTSPLAPRSTSKTGHRGLCGSFGSYSAPSDTR